MSWTDPCSNCGEHRADCDCGDWNGYKAKKMESVMRPEIRCLCVTAWGAVLELISINQKRGIADVADPNARDAGQYIGLDDVVLVARVKNRKHGPAH